MLNQFSRTELLIGKDGIEKLQNAKVAIFGIGGVGSFVVEGLVRAGVGNFILVDDDKICLTNLNRQIIATRKTVGKPKVEVAKERILEINPNANVEIYQEFFMPDSEEILDNTVDYIVDAVDTVTAKIELVVRANKLNIPIISSMGTGNKLDPTKFEVTDIYKTSICPLAKVMRKELRNRGIEKLKVVYSKEEQIKPDETLECSCKTGCICPPGTKRKCTVRNQVPGSISFVPSVVGLIMAGEVIKDIIKTNMY
jgi:tRNA A37 threonylcarbamoyladenosine dehydratase